MIFAISHAEHWNYGFTLLSKLHFTCYIVWSSTESYKIGLLTVDTFPSISRFEM